MIINRRKILKLAGTTGAVAIAGCVDDIAGDEEGDSEDGDDNGDSDNGDSDNGDSDNGVDSAVPDYARWIAWDEDDVVLIYAGLQGVDDIDVLEDADPEADEEDHGGLPEHDDPLLAVPGSGLFGVLTVAEFELADTGLGDLVEMDAGDDFETEIEELLFVNGAIVLLGEVDTDEIGDTLTEPSEDEFGFGGPTVYEQTDEIGEFVVYELADDDEDEDDDVIGGFEQDSAIAVGEEAIVVGDRDDGRDAIDVAREAIEAETGDRERAIDAESEFEWLLETAGHSHVAFGGYGLLEPNDQESDLTVFDGATGFVASMTVESETDWRAETAVSGIDLDDAARSEVEEEFGATANDVTHEFDGDRVTIAANWDDDPTA